jgi:hypothetical protein
MYNEDEDAPPQPPPSIFNPKYIYSLSVWTRLMLISILCLFCFGSYAFYLQNNEAMQEQLKIFKER